VKFLDPEQMGRVYWNRSRYVAIKEVEAKIAAFSKAKATAKTIQYWLVVHCWLEAKAASMRRERKAFQ